MKHLKDKNFTLRKFENLMKKNFPYQNAASWDFVSFALKYKNHNPLIKKIVFCLDLDSKNLQKILRLNPELVITHHPFIFNQKITDDLKEYSYKKKIYKKILANKIAVFNLHTNFDFTNSATACAIFEKIFQHKTKQKKWKILTPGSLTFSWENSTENLVLLFKKNTKLVDFRISRNLKLTEKIKNVTIFPGSWSFKEIVKIKQITKNDLIISSDIKWSDWLAFEEQKIKVLEVPHLIEQFFYEKVKQILSLFVDEKKLIFLEMENKYKNLNYEKN